MTDENIATTGLSATTCSVCGALPDRLATLTTYKHWWRWCEQCGNVRREHRTVYPAERLLPRTWAQRVLPRSAMTVLYANPDVAADERHFYDYYQSSSALDVEKTKWASQIERLRERFSEAGIETAGRAVLDVSGGPGFVTREMGKTARRAVVTEFSQDAVDGMVKNLSIDSVKFDYNADRLNQVVDGPFDVVLIDSSINFCDDLSTLATDLTRVMTEDGVVYVSFAIPTLGCALRWQFDDYTYRNLYTEATLRSSFESAGFALKRRFVEEPFRLDANAGLRSRALRTPFYLAYGLRSLRHSAIGGDLSQRAYAYVFTRHAHEMGPSGA